MAARPAVQHGTPSRRSVPPGEEGGARGRGPGHAILTAGAFLGGVLLSGVGVGLGLLRVRVGAPTPVVALGLLALALGVGLTAWSMLRLVRSASGWWRIVVAPVAVIAVVLGVYVLAVPLRAAVPPRAPAPVSGPAGLPIGEVTVPTPDGEVLTGWYVPSQDGAAVVLLPGASGSRDSLGQHMEALARGGYGVLALDPRGHGDSTGRGMDWGWYGELDVPAAVTYLAGRDDVDPGRIAVVGLSVGGEQAIGAASVDPRIRAVVAEGATGRCAADLHWLSDVYGWRGWVSEGLEHAKTAVADVLTPARPPAVLREAAAAAAPRPILLVVAGERPDELFAAEDIRRAAPRTVQIWVVPGAHHTDGLSTDPLGWNERVLGFLDDATR